MNNKMIKGSVAGATGIVLLMGGFGTYALWNDETPLSGTVQSGDMDIALVGSPAWQDISTKKTATAWAASDFMVPGDKVTMTQLFNVDATGKNLALNLQVEDIDPGDAADDWDNLVVTMTLDGTALAGDTNRGFIAPDAADGQHTLEVTYEFLDVNDDTDADESITLSDYAIKIQQVRPGDQA